jgi:hypothetical protein
MKKETTLLISFKMKKFSSLLTGALLFVVVFAFGQENAIWNKVQRAQQKGIQFEQTDLFAFKAEIAEDKRHIVSEGAIMSINDEAIEELLAEEYDAISVQIPIGQSQMIALNLLRNNDLVSDDFIVSTSSSGGESVNIELGAYYQGIISTESNSWVALSIFDGEVIAVLYSPVFGEMNLGKLEGNTSGDHVLYTNRSWQIPMPFNCGNESNEDLILPQQQWPEVSNPNNCVRIYFECEYDMFQANGSSVQNTVNKMTGIYNVVKTLYDNESINTTVSEIFVWDTPDPYATGPSTVDALNSFRNYRNGTGYNGDLAHLVSRGAPTGGGVAWVNALCSSYGYAYSAIQSSYSQFPTYSWTTNVITHEMGHNLGSPHTHDCAWDVNGDGTAAEAIDGCGPAAGYSSGCNGPIPPNGGTIMSYCHLVSAGINLSNGFGTLPGNLIRYNVYNAGCLADCSGGTSPYCTSEGSNASYEWISNVTIGSFSNNSGSAGYSDFTNQTVSVNAGQNYSISLTPGFSGTLYQEYWKIWIDFNADGDFADAGEEVYSGGPSSSTVTGTIAIPATANGTTRMRVSMKWDAAQTACEVFDYGEVEDYTIEISSSGADTQAPTAPTNLAASGTTTTSTDLSWTASTDNVGVTGYSVYVDGTLDGTTANTTYTVSGLTPLTTYDFYVTASDAAGNISGNSNTISVTTLSAGGGSTVLLGSYFESGWDGWQDGGVDCSRYSGTRSWEGSYSIFLRDNSGVASAMTSPTLDLTGYNQIDVEFYFYPNSMENGEDFWLRYFDGNSWTTVAAWARGSSFDNDVFYVATVTLNSANYTFPSNAQIRFQCDASGNGDRIYIDAVTVTANNTSALPAHTNPITTIKEVGSGSTGLDIVTVEDGSILYPNPASESITLLTEDQPEQVNVINLAGQIVMQISNTEDLETVDVSNLPAGSYIVAIQFEDEIEYIKFVKQ